jgi:RNA polymerase sigma-70 factor (ECF subfamily)
VLARSIAAPTPLDRAGAFGRMLDRGLDAHYRLATVILGDPLEAEDAVHDAAVSAWRGFGDLRDPGSFDAWFGRILVNGCRDRLRARRRRPVIRALPFLGDLDRGLVTADASLAVADRDALARAFGALEPEQAIVVVLRFYRDLTVPEIAARLGIAEGTVKSRLHHALRRLRTAVRAGEEDSR